MLMAGRFLAQAVYRGACRTGTRAGGAGRGVRFLWSLTDWPSEADAPVARFVGFAPLSLTSALSGDRANCRSFAQDDGAERFASDDSVLPMSHKPGAELCSLVEEAGVGPGVDREVGAEADEVRISSRLRRTKRSWRRSSCLRPVRVPVPPSPLRSGRLAYKPWRIMRMWAVPIIKFVFLKELSLYSSSH
jgi:hypothetical protein